MRVVTKLMILGAVVLGVMLPSAASASSPVVTHLYFDGSRTISSSDYSFTNVSNVFYGTNVSHGVKVGQATLICRILTDSTARCTGKLTIFKAGTTDTPDHSVYFTDEMLNFRSSPLVISLTLSLIHI